MGLTPSEEETETVKNLPQPQNVKDLQRFLGLVNYVAKFVSKMSEKKAPLRELLRKDLHFVWEQKQDALKILKTFIL